MKKTNFLLLFLFLTLSLAGQRNSDYGIFAGVSSYAGDINPERILYSPLPAGGVFYRYNFNPRQALRANVFIGGLRGNDLDFANAFQQSRAASFKENVGEFAVQYEFNFFPYSTEKGRTVDYTPYLAAGGGVAFAGSAIVPVIPFSFGFKINIFKNFGLEAEYGFRKTFYDNFDGLTDMVDPEDLTWMHNNDWYSFMGVSFTWKIYNKLVGCPAFAGDVEKKRKRQN